MGERPDTDETLGAIYARAIALAAGRLSAMGGYDEPVEFDRGARSVGVLVRTAMQVNALQSQTEKDVAAHDAAEKAAAPKTLSQDQIAEIRADIVAKLERIKREETRSSDDAESAGEDGAGSERS
ncbi:MAG: hypothetical protein AAGJ87_16835 [Pseudomonadota bacterium]